jgi:hypothetical protein
MNRRQRSLPVSVPTGSTATAPLTTEHDVGEMSYKHFRLCRNGGDIWDYPRVRRKKAHYANLLEHESTTLMGLSLLDVQNVRSLCSRCFRKLRYYISFLSTDDD